MNPAWIPRTKAVMVRDDDETCTHGRVLTRKDRQRSSEASVRPRLERASDWISSPVSMEVAA